MALDTPRNQLLASLAPKDFDALRPHLCDVDLPMRYDMEQPDRRIQHVYFPDSGIASVVAVHTNDTRVEVGLIGCEGMSGLAVLLGDRQSPNSTYMQIAGKGQRISADALCTALINNTRLQAVLLKYAQAFLVQTAQTATSNARNHIEARLSRWVLMAHDRVDGATIAMTHEALALMLAVRRAGVTQAVQALTKQGLIESVRGTITVLDRKGLERRAGDSYGVPEREYQRLFGNLHEARVNAKARPWRDGQSAKFNNADA